MAIVATSHDQEVLLKKHLKDFGEELTICGVNDVAGLQKECIIISTVKYGKKDQNNRDIRRVYIAFTKASKKLIVLGSLSNLKEIQPLNQYIDLAEEEQWKVSLNSLNNMKSYFPDDTSKVLPSLFEAAASEDKGKSEKKKKKSK